MSELRHPSRGRLQTRRFTDRTPFEPKHFLSLIVSNPVKLLLYHAYHSITSLRSKPKPAGPPVRIVCLSDTHNLTPAHVPAGDILVHAGDLTVKGSIVEIQAQVDWLCSLPHKEIIVISGNHDTYLDSRIRPSLAEHERTGQINWGRIHYLQHQSLTLDITPATQSSEPIEDAGTSTETLPLLAGSRLRRRRIMLYGAPQVPGPQDVDSWLLQRQAPPLLPHAFQYERGVDAWSEIVHEDTDVLITHTPPQFHLDLPLPTGMGCEHLLKEVKRVQPKLHIFGHVHWGAGQEVVWWDGCHDAYISGMQVQSRTLGLLSPRTWWSIVKVLYQGVRGLIWAKVWGGHIPNTIMVNAAQMHGNTGKLGNSVQVLEI